MSWVRRVTMMCDGCGEIHTGHLQTHPRCNSTKWTRKHFDLNVIRVDGVSYDLCTPCMTVANENPERAEEWLMQGTWFDVEAVHSYIHDSRERWREQWSEFFEQYPNEAKHMSKQVDTTPMDSLTETQREYVHALIERSKEQEDSPEYDRINDDVLDPLWYAMERAQALEATDVYKRHFQTGEH